MKKSKHTSGPWLITTIDGEDCLMVGGGDGSEVVADIRTHWPEEEAEANAHLISSAPEMLEALRQLHAMHRAFSGNENWTTLDNEARALAEEAIAHAEGRELGTDHRLKLGEGMMTIDLKEADKCDEEEEA